MTEAASPSAARRRLLRWRVAVAVLPGVLVAVSPLIVHVIEASPKPLITAQGAAPPAPLCDLCVLSSSDPGALSATGGGAIRVPGGNIVVDSSSTQAAVVAGNGRVQSAESAVVGSSAVTGGGAAVPAFTQVAAPGSPDPFSGLTTPTASGQPSAVNVTDSQAVAIGPGTYSQINVSGHGKLSLSAGLYVITQGFAVSGSGAVVGTEVTIFFTGQSTMDMSGLSVVNLTAPPAGPLAGVSLYYDRSDTGQLLSDGATESPSDRYIGGSIYAASAPLDVSSLQVGGRVAVKSVAVSGHGELLVEPITAAVFEDPAGDLVFTVRPDLGTFNLSVADVGQYVGTAPFVRAQAGEWQFNGPLSTLFTAVGGAAPSAVGAQASLLVDLDANTATIVVAVQGHQYDLSDQPADPTAAPQAADTILTDAANGDWTDVYPLLSLATRTQLTRAQFLAQVQSQNPPHVLSIKVASPGAILIFGPYREWQGAVTIVASSSAGINRQYTANVSLIDEGGAWHLLETSSLVGI